MDRGDIIKNIHHDISLFLNTKVEGIEFEIEEYVNLKYDGDIAEAIMQVIENENQVVISLEDMNCFRNEVRNRLKPSLSSNAN